MDKQLFKDMIERPTGYRRAEQEPFQLLADYEEKFISGPTHARVSEEWETRLTFKIRYYSSHPDALPSAKDQAMHTMHRLIYRDQFEAAVRLERMLYADEPIDGYNQGIKRALRDLMNTVAT